MSHVAFDAVRNFESAVAKYTGSPYAVAVNSCTSALFLCCYRMGVEVASIPKRTYCSVPCSIIHAGGFVEFDDREWSGDYTLDPYPIVDSALRFRPKMYRAGELRCLSFHHLKHLPIGSGGMILTDDADAATWFRSARYHGRNEAVYAESVPTMIGWHCYMIPEHASRGLLLLDSLSGTHPDIPPNFYDLSTNPIYSQANAKNAVKRQPEISLLDLSNDEHVEFLYRLLEERHRRGDVNLTERELPSFESHVEHLNSKRYACAFVTREVGELQAFGYAEQDGELGIFVREAACGKGKGSALISYIVGLHSRRYYARVHPQNGRSNRMFSRLGFTERPFESGHKVWVLK